MTRDGRSTVALAPFPLLYGDSTSQRLLFRARLLLDFQVRTVYRHAAAFVPTLSGIIVDIGAGGGPYRHLVNTTNARYYAIDVATVGFGYSNLSAAYFDGERLPFENDSIDAFLCTEVLEHAEHPDALVREMHRVLKPGGRGMVTVPWSARYHYVPYDYHRFTPARLERLFGDFPHVRIEPRGTDMTAIASKVIVAYVRLLERRPFWSRLARGAIAVVLAPVAAAAVLAGHLSLAWSLGSTDDPLGYTVWLEK